jgi:hypothetical protein
VSERPPPVDCQIRAGSVAFVFFLWVTVILMHQGYARIFGAVLIGCDGCDDQEFAGCAW